MPVTDDLNLPGTPEQRRAYTDALCALSQAAFEYTALRCAFSHGDLHALINKVVDTKINKSKGVPDPKDPSHTVSAEALGRQHLVEAAERLVDASELLAAPSAPAVTPAVGLPASSPFLRLLTAASALDGFLTEACCFHGPGSLEIDKGDAVVVIPVGDVVNVLTPLRKALNAITDPEAAQPCPECGRKRAEDFQDVVNGLCPKWWAIRDPEAEKDCQRFAKAKGGK